MPNLNFSRFNRACCAVFLSVFVFAGAVMAHGVLPTVAEAQAQTVNRFVIEGNQRVDDAAILSFMTFRAGQAATQARLDASFDALFGSGLFEDVKLNRRGTTLVIRVVENPIVVAIRYSGNQRFNNEQLQQKLVLRSRSVFSQARLQSDIDGIKAAYSQSGFTVTSVTADVEPVGDNRVRVSFIINEGDRAQIARIKFVGNESFGESRLHSVMRTKQSHLLSFLTQDDIYDPERVNVDAELLRIFYQNQGFPDMSVLGSEANFDAQKNAYFVTITIDEGQRYRFGEIDVRSSIPNMDLDVLNGFIETISGSYYSAQKIQETVEDMTFQAASNGHSFAEVRPRIDRDLQNRVMNVTYLVDEGPRVYVERINIFGNTHTRDFVIRREFEFDEGDPFNRALVQRGQGALESTGFFESVRVTVDQGSASDQVVLNVYVRDARTGSIGGTAGYSSSDGLLGEVSITENNFLGRGQFVKASYSRGEKTNSYEFSFTEPYFAGLKISSGIDIYQRSSSEAEDSSDGAGLTYGRVDTGGKLRFGAPIARHTRGDIYFSANQTTFSDDFTGAGETAPTYITDDPNILTTSVGYRITFDSLDSKVRPTEGIIAQLEQELAIPPGDQLYLKTEAKGRYYQELSSDLGVVASLRAQGGAIVSLNGEDVHVTNTFQGGPKLVRGFAANGLGPRDSTTDDAVGGLFYAGISTEIEFGIPFIPEDFGVRGALWADAGTLFEPSGAVPAPLDSSNIRASVGASVIWHSPFGPLRGDFAHILQQESFDNTETFQFTISSIF